MQSRTRYPLKAPQSRNSQKLVPLHRTAYKRNQLNSAKKAIRQASAMNLEPFAVPAADYTESYRHIWPSRKSHTVPAPTTNRTAHRKKLPHHEAKQKARAPPAT